MTSKKSPANKRSRHTGKTILKHRQYNTISIVIALLIVLVFLYIMFPSANAIGFLLIPFFASDLSEPPLMLFCLVFIAAVLALAYYFVRKERIAHKAAVLWGAFAVSVIAVLIMSPITIPIYQKYRVTRVPPLMEKYLEDRYTDDFTVVEAKYQSVQILGDAKGVRAVAYPSGNPEYRFTIREGHDKEFIETYVEQYGEKMEKAVTAQLTRDLKEAFGDRLVLESLSIRESSMMLTGSPDSISSAKSIKVVIRERFAAVKWPEYKKLLVQSSVLLNKPPYSAYQYWVSIKETEPELHAPSTPDRFYCDLLPSQRNTSEKLERRLTYCIDSYNDFYKNGPKAKL